MRIPDGIATAPLAGGALIHDARSGRIYRLNLTAARTWQMLREGSSATAIATRLVMEHGAGPQSAQHDVESYVAALGRADLLGPAEPASDMAPVRAPAGTPCLDTVYRLIDVPIRVTIYTRGLATSVGLLADPAEARDDGEPADWLKVDRHAGEFVVWSRAGHVAFAPGAPGARWLLLREIVRASPKPWLCLLHASAVAAPAGTILIAGPSGAGKSTLLAGLVRDGLGFVADDLVPLQATSGLVWPVRTAASFKRGSWSVVARLFPELMSQPVVQFGGRTMRHLWLGGSVSTTPSVGRPSAALLFPRFREGATTSSARLDLEGALTRLVSSGSVLPASDAALAEFLDWLQGVRSFELTYGCLEDGVAAVRELVAGEAPQEVQIDRASA